MKRLFVIALSLGSLLGGCKKHHPRTPQEGEQGIGGELATPSHEVALQFCQRGENTEASASDTNGDMEPDVARVFRVYGTGPTARRVITCREVDLNNDGRRDVVRWYSDEGRPLREQADRDFDGRPEEWDYFEDARIVQSEVDSDRDGMIDTRTYFQNGRVTRVERDTTNRSTHEAWRPNRWEYYDNGRMIRIGYDEDGDGRVDRWDRDEILADQRAREQAAQLAADSAASNESADSGDAGDSGGNQQGNQ